MSIPEYRSTTSKDILFEIRLFKASMRDRIPQWIARHLPRKVVYFAAIRVWANATTGKYGHTNAVETKCDEAIKRWEES
jgi:ribosomal protein L39E